MLVKFAIKYMFTDNLEILLFKSCYWMLNCEAERLYFVWVLSSWRFRAV
jgi:hypothetical protein